MPEYPAERTGKTKTDKVVLFWGKSYCSYSKAFSNAESMTPILKIFSNSFNAFHKRLRGYFIDISRYIFFILNILWIFFKFQLLPCAKSVGMTFCFYVWLYKNFNEWSKPQGLCMNTISLHLAIIVISRLPKFVLLICAEHRL